MSVPANLWVENAFPFSQGFLLMPPDTGQEVGWAGLTVIPILQMMKTYRGG